LLKLWGLKLLNRLTVMANTPQSGLPVSFAYQYNNANQRIRTVLADGSYWVYEYDEQGQVIRGRRFWADHTPVAGQQFDYAFDDIGNRQTTLAGGDQTGGNQRSASYTADRLNRYSSRTVPATFDVLGLATATSAVTVNSQTAYRKGEYFRREVTASNSSAPDWEGVTVAVSGVSSVTGNVFVPQTPEAYTYDNDGNLLTDGRWTYTWDAENRLVKQEAHAGVPAGARLKLDYEYDHQGRRIRKAVSTWNGSAWTLYQVRKFVYDGWNLIADLFDNDTLRVQFMWGTDLSGSMQGAGGVGGLVKIYDHASSKTYFPGYDGNGNVALLVDGDTGAAGAVYEYGPFGELIRSSGVYAATNPFRFSTKYQDKETDLLYYGYRYYNPSTGRWINRDPIEEAGGKNLLGFVGNNAVGTFDPNGLWQEDGHFYTVYAVARANKLTDPKAFELAYYAQYPDEDFRYDAITAGWNLHLRSPNREFHMLIQTVLHSLHGGNADDARRWRDCLSKMIRNAQLEPWKRGLLIHALGDAFAHTKSGGPDNGAAYGPPWGHFPITTPDIPQNRPELFMHYVIRLSWSLGGQASLADLRDIAHNIAPSSLQSKEDRHRAAREYVQTRWGYNHEYDPAGGAKLDDNMAILGEQEVSKFLRFVRLLCGCAIRNPSNYR
jgi:RHS repeat-associated protein